MIYCDILTDLYIKEHLTFYVCNIYTKRIHKHVSTARNIHIVFREQAVYDRGTLIEESLSSERK